MKFAPSLTIQNVCKHKHCHQFIYSILTNPDFANLKVITKSAEDAFPSALQLKQSSVKTVLKSSEIEDGATIKEKCPKCGNEEMQYHTLQLRSADEGATVFYTCTSCGYRFRTNN